MFDAVANPNDQSRGGSPSQFKHALDRPPRGDHPQGMGFGFSFDAMNDTVRPDKNHIEGDIGVFHPHLNVAHFAEIKQHTPVFRQMAAKHQASGARLRCIRKLDQKRVCRSVLANDGKRREFLRQRAPRAQAAKHGQNRDQYCKERVRVCALRQERN